ncbi:MAG: hypothetical protein PQJ60_12715, partial [Spirochaetales bacterium]|nr:hypothetical protein [Spirochaetales bacterium]
LQAGEEGQLRVWNKDSFTEEERALYLEDPYREEAIEAVTTGYELTATTFNLRLRQGPGTDYEYQIYTYFDVKSGSVKTFTSMWAGTNLRILARTAEKQQVGKWYNYWYYVEYKEPAGDMIVYRNAWMFGEFLDVAENKDRWVRIDYPQNEAALYNDYQVGIEGVTAGSPMSVNIQVKNSLGVVIKDVPVDDYDQVAGTFSHTISKRDETLYIGSNTINLVAEYSDFSKISKQITFYVHESMGERAKPVIYLYPPRETDVRVEVSPQSGFSFTEPEYGEGWEVRATPEGLITNREDGKTWPYLFWESNSESRPETKEGFVVKREDLDSFFRDKLTFMGLIPREIEDFLEYWIPVLNEGPWYYISFIDQATQDAEAPLTITPRPDTIIRVFFDSRPLVEPISVPEQELKKGKREGFTVIEWGGMRYHN